MTRRSPLFSVLLPVFVSFAVSLAAPIAADRTAKRSDAQASITWRSFDAATFQLALKEGKLVLLSAVVPWGHRDRIMSELTFADPRVISLVNEKFIAVKVDPLLRPDIDGRYGTGASPTTAFLLPSGHPFYMPDTAGKILKAGGSYFSADSLALYLEELAKYYESNREQAEKAASEIANSVLAHKDFDTAPLTPGILEVSVTKMLEAFGQWVPDPAIKGVYSPDADSLELAVYYFVRKGDRNVLDRALLAMTDMSRGGIRDQLGGGFHRAAGDAAWRVPWFEKLLGTNAQMLQAYTDAHKLTLSSRYRIIGEETASYVMGTLADPQGWFYAYQEADARLGEDGDYYTFTLEEAKGVLSEEEQKLLLPAFDIAEWGEMVDSAPHRNVLFLEEGPRLLAERFSMEEAKATEVFESGRKKLLEARARRPAPAVGKILIADANAEMAGSLIRSGDAWKRSDLTASGILALEFLWNNARDPNSGLIDHAWTPGQGRAGLPIFFSDQAYTARALVAAAESTGDPNYLDRARLVADAADRVFADSLDGGYMDRVSSPEGPGLLAWPARSIRDNALFAETLIRIRHISGRAEDDKYMRLARKTLESWADEYPRYRQAASPFGLAAHKYQTPPVEVIVLGAASDPDYANLHARAKAVYHPWKIVRHLTAEGAEAELKTRKVPPVKGAAVLFCGESRCAGPFAGKENLSVELDAFLNVSGKPAAKASPDRNEKDD